MRINCWNEKLEVVVIENKPSELKKLVEKVNRKSNHLGLETFTDWRMLLAVWMIENGYIIKDINPDLAYDQRKSGIYIDMESMLPYGLMKIELL